MMLRSIVFGATVAVMGLGLTVAGATDPTGTQGQTTNRSSTQATQQGTSDTKDTSATDKAKDAAESASKAVSDSWITLKTKMALLADKQVSSTDVHVSTQQGVITLQGKVPSAEAKEAAERDALKIDGAQRVVNRLAVVPAANQKSAERRDEQITQDVEGRLKKETSLKQASIDVHTDNGIVTLRGDAPSLQASVRASEVAHRVPGVRAVQNDLHVKEQTRG
jgi:hyperosmotically inducible protein